MAAERRTEAGAAAELGITSPSWRRRWLAYAMLFRLEAAFQIDMAAATALATVTRRRLRPRCSWTRFIAKLPDPMDIVNVIGLEGMSGREGATGQYPNASTNHWAAVNVFCIVIGAGGVMGFKDPLGARRADCGLLRLAHCQDLSRGLLMNFKAMMAPYPRKCAAPGRADIRNRVRLRMEGSASGRLMLLPTTTMETSADVYGASRRLWPLVASMELPLR